MKDTQNEVKKDTLKPRFNIYEPEGEVTTKIFLITLFGKRSNKDILKFYNDKMQDLHPIQTGLKQQMTPKQKIIQEHTKTKLVNRTLLKHPEIQYEEQITYPEIKINLNNDQTLKQTTCDNSIKWLIKNYYLTGTTTNFEVNYIQLLIDTIMLHEAIAFINPEGNSDLKFSFRNMASLLHIKNFKRASIYMKKAQKQIDSFRSEKQQKERFETLRKEVPADAIKYYLEYFLILNEAEKIFPSKADFNELFNKTKTNKALLLSGFMYVLARIDGLKTASEELTEYSEELHRRQGLLCYMLEHSNENTTKMIEDINMKCKEIENQCSYLTAKNKEKKEKIPTYEEETLADMKLIFSKFFVSLNEGIKKQGISTIDTKKRLLIFKKINKEAENKVPLVIAKLIEFGQHSD